MLTTFISTDELAKNLNNPDWVIVDVSYVLSDKAAGVAMYEAAHIPGAVYAHTYKDLSGPPLTDQGRHPLPSAEKLATVFSQLGIDASKQVIAYDNRGGVTSARLWWLLRYMGHKAVAVLDGGTPAWRAEDRPMVGGVESNAPAEFKGEAKREMLVVIDEVMDQPMLVDSRDAGRYRGDSAGSDAAAGHIAGAGNRHYVLNWDENHKLHNSDRLRGEFNELFGDTPSEDVTFYCGSGVSACHNLLTLEHIGMTPGKLYVGSWSEWSQFEDRPKETG